MGNNWRFASSGVRGKCRTYGIHNGILRMSAEVLGYRLEWKENWGLRLEKYYHLLILHYSVYISSLNFIKLILISKILSSNMTRSYAHK